MFLHCLDLVAKRGKASRSLRFGMFIATSCASLVATSSHASDCSEAETAPPATSQRVLVVAADPNSLPLTNDRSEGFENKVAELIAREMKAELQYVWHAQRRGFFRRTMGEGGCHLAMGAPVGFERALTTRPYYRSTYMFVTRKDRQLNFHSLDDPRLRKLRVGVQVIGDDGLNSPPAHALSARGIVENVVGYSVYGDYSKPNPTSRIIEGVANGDVDVALVWGPLAAYIAPRQPVKLELRPLPERDELSQMQFAFDICVGVRKGDPKLRDEVDAVIARCQGEIDSILDGYGIHRMPSAQRDDSKPQ
jgi:mxaJ protein